MAHCNIIRLPDGEFTHEYSLAEYQFKDRLRNRIMEYTKQNNFQLKYGDMLIIDEYFDTREGNEGTLVYNGKELIFDNEQDDDTHPFAEFKVLVNGIPTNYWKDLRNKPGFTNDIVHFEHKEYRRNIIKNLIVSFDGYSISKFNVGSIGTIKLVIEMNTRRNGRFSKKVYRMLTKGYTIESEGFNKNASRNTFDMINKETGDEKSVEVIKDEEEFEEYFPKCLNLLLKRVYLEFTCFNEDYTDTDPVQDKTLFLWVY